MTGFIATTTDDTCRISTSPGCYKLVLKSATWFRREHTQSNRASESCERHNLPPSPVWKIVAVNVREISDAMPCFVVVK